MKLNSLILKIVACICMTIDHIGELFFPEVSIFKIIGRLAFPLFAFFIAEGCKYTRNRLRRLLEILCLGIICETVYILYTGYWYGNVLLTFSLSIILIYILQDLKTSIIREEQSSRKATLMTISFFASVCMVYVLTTYVYFDYEFIGILLPVIFSIFQYRKVDGETIFHSMNLDKAMYAIGVLLFIIFYRTAYSLPALISIIFILLYDGTRGNIKFKYGFYLYYPVHLLMLEIINYFVK